ncbi:hypothetical protein [Acidisphaera sp. L21]|uniref:hypothetical protein n=1 Tax=Acidisphaera sp. L21 TaxID=1641851 RepID=UPI00131C8B32|nr:hypothetical protein [Acidisphaera sp. L21]
MREALAELVQIGLSVARMIGRAAEAETALADAAAMAEVASGVPAVATSLAEAIAADQAASAAGEARRDAVRRTDIVAAAFNQVSRAIRRTVLLAERLDRGWARPGRADDQPAMARRQIARAVRDAIKREADGARAERLGEALRERLDALDTLDEIAGRPTKDVIRDICRDLGLDPARIRFNSAREEGGEHVAPSLAKGTAQAPDGEARARASPAKERPG